VEPKRYGVSVSSVCEKVGMSRQNYYARRRERQRQAVDADLVVELVRQERGLQPRLGTRKMHFLFKDRLSEAGVKMGRDRMFEVLREREMLVERRISEYPTTTSSYHCLPVFENLIKDRDVSLPNQVWVGDLTYLRTEEGFMYLALLTDKMSRKIVGYHCGDTLEAVGCVRALEMALKEMPGGAKPIHHSDRGSQYCCHEYVNRLVDRGLKISMTENNHCAENALAERMNGIVKGEYGLGQKFKTKASVLVAVDQSVSLYNTRRPHSSLGNRFPHQVHSLTE
jgi:transposase InsO family protein